jgi:hypothetical protein
VTRAKKTAKRKTPAKKNLSDLEILEKLQADILRHLNQSDFQAKVADFLKVLDYKTKLKLSDSGKKTFWDLIEQIRKEELGEKNED